MAAHDDPFFVGEGAGFVQDDIGDTDFANIVQQRPRRNRCSSCSGSLSTRAVDSASRIIRWACSSVRRSWAEAAAVRACTAWTGVALCPGRALPPLPPDAPDIPWFFVSTGALLRSTMQTQLRPECFALYMARSAFSTSSSRVT